MERQQAIKTNQGLPQRETRPTVKPTLPARAPVHPLLQLQLTLSRSRHDEQLFVSKALENRETCLTSSGQLAYFVFSLLSLGCNFPLANLKK